jgi:hypothetical protein
MRSKSLVVAVAVVVVGVLSWVTLTAGQTSDNLSVTRWEYKLVQMPPIPVSGASPRIERQVREKESLLNTHGAEGWEAVEMVGQHLLFKRPKN